MLLHYGRGRCATPHKTNIFLNACKKLSRKPIEKFCDLYLEKLCLQNRKCEKVSVGGEDVPLPLIWSARILILTPEMDSLTPKTLYNMYHMLKLRWEVLLLIFGCFWPTVRWFDRRFCPGGLRQPALRWIGKFDWPIISWLWTQLLIV